MDRDRVDGLTSILGDSELKAEGRMAEREGRFQNTIGGAKDALREANRRQ